MDLFTAQDHGELTFVLAADEVQDGPVADGDLLVEELDARVADRHRGGSKFIGILTVKEIGFELFLGELVGGFGMEFGEEPHFPEIACRMRSDIPANFEALAIL